MKQLDVEIALGVDGVEQLASPRLRVLLLGSLLQHHRQMVAGAARDLRRDRKPPGAGPPPGHRGAPRPAVRQHLPQDPFGFRPRRVGKRLPALPPQRPVGR